MKCILEPETLGKIHKKGIPTLPKQDRYPIIICKNGLFFRSEHWVPRRKHDRLLFHQLHDVGRNVLLFYYYAEHVVVKPFVGHNQIALIA